MNKHMTMTDVRFRRDLTLRQRTPSSPRRRPSRCFARLPWLARAPRTVSLAIRYPTCETCSPARLIVRPDLAATSGRRCATDEAHSHVHDPITCTSRKATSGVPGRNSRPLFEQFATFRKTRGRYLLRKIGVLHIARCWAQSRKTDHSVRCVFARKLSLRTIFANS